MTLKRPKDKGTRFETYVVNTARDFGYDEDHAYREKAGHPWDITVQGSTGRKVDAVAAKADFGPALVTISLGDFFHLISSHGDGARIECKRLAKVALHTIWTDHFAKG